MQFMSEQETSQALRSSKALDTHNIMHWSFVQYCTVQLGVDKAVTELPGVS